MLLAFLAAMFRLPDGGVWSNLLASGLLGSLAWWRHRVHMARHHTHLKQHVTDELERLIGRD
jgi:hypothetical protein